MEDWLALRNQLDTSPEHEIVRRIDAILFCLKLFEDNYRDLMGLLDRLENPDIAFQMAVWAREHRADFSAQIERATRLFHNFLASVQTLVEHTRTNARRLYKNHPFFAEYQAKVNYYFASNPLHVFIQDLRNYTLHHELPIITGQFTLSKVEGTDDKFDITFVLKLDTTELKKRRKEWKSISKQFLSKHAETLPLKQLIVDYYSLVKEFHDWLTERQLQVNAEKLERFHEMVERIATLEESTD